MSLAITDALRGAGTVTKVGTGELLLDGGLSDFYNSVNKTAARKDPYENPQTFYRLNVEVEHPKPVQHMLGLVGGNEVALSRGNLSDIESDLKGITRPNSDCTARHHLPDKNPVFTRHNPKDTIRLDATPVPLRSAQFWAYPSVIAPEPFRKETCGQPHKY